MNGRKTNFHCFSKKQEKNSTVFEKVTDFSKYILSPIFVQPGDLPPLPFSSEHSLFEFFCLLHLHHRRMETWLLEYFCTHDCVVLCLFVSIHASHLLDVFYDINYKLENDFTSDDSHELQ